MTTEAMLQRGDRFETIPCLSRSGKRARTSKEDTLILSAACHGLIIKPYSHWAACAGLPLMCANPDLIRPYLHADPVVS